MSLGLHAAGTAMIGRARLPRRLAGGRVVSASDTVRSRADSAAGRCAARPGLHA